MHYLFKTVHLLESWKLWTWTPLNTFYKQTVGFADVFIFFSALKDKYSINHWLEIPWHRQNEAMIFIILPLLTVSPNPTLLVASAALPCCPRHHPATAVTQTSVVSVRHSSGLLDWFLLSVPSDHPLQSYHKINFTMSPTSLNICNSSWGTTGYSLHSKGLGSISPAPSLQTPTTSSSGHATAACGPQSVPSSSVPKLV